MDGAGELSFGAADRFTAGFAFGLFAFEVGTCGRVDSSLCDRDLVERAVELAVATTVEPVSSVLAAVRVERCDAGVAGELASLSKRSIGPISQRSFAAVKGPQPGSCSRPGASVCRSAFEFAVELADRPGQGTAAADQLTRDPDLRRLFASGRSAVRPGRSTSAGRAHRPAPGGLGRARGGASATVAGRVVALRRDRRGGRRAISAPAPSPAGMRPVEPRLLQRGSCDSDRVDRVRLAARAVDALAARSTSAAPAPSAHPQQRAPARGHGSPADSPQPPTTARREAFPTRQASPYRRRSVRSASGRPTSSTATAVSEALCFIKSRSTVSGRRRRHNAEKSTLQGATCGKRVSRRQPESASTTRRHHHPHTHMSSGMSPDCEGR